MLFLFGRLIFEHFEQQKIYVRKVIGVNLKKKAGVYQPCMP